jgi:outer membrane receptor protein involved in Fe transport
MRLKHIFSALLVLFSTLTLVAQQNNPGIIKGKIIDKTSNEPVGYSTVSILEGQKPIAVVSTKEDGSFEIKNLELKSYILKVNFIGYKDASRTITLSEGNTEINLGNITLESNANTIETVSIVKERSTIEQKADRKVVTIGKDLIASGTTASEIFNNIPTVSIDPQTKELSLRGNSNVRVLIDGKPTNIDAGQLLQQIPSASIKQVELITNPSSKYNPEGNSGIINIILNKNTQNGFNGSITTGYTFGITPKTNQSLNLNYKVRKVNFYTNYGFNHGRNRSFGFVEADRPNLENRQDFNFANTNTSHLAKIGIDYYINDNNTLSFFTNWNIADGKGNSNTNINYYNNTTFADELQTITNNSGNITQTYDLNYKHNFKKKGELIEFQANYAKTSSEDISCFRNNGVLRLNDIDSKTNYAQFNIDYTNPIDDNTKIEMGFESRIQDGQNNFYNESLAFYGTNPFTFNRNIHAIYTNYSKSFGKFSAQVGVRIEEYTLDAKFERNERNPNYFESTSVADEIFTAYPSAYLSYKLDDNNTFNLNYTRRVDRPSIGQINPIREWTTPLLESRGNPALEPQFTNSFEINHTKIFSLGSVTSAVFYRLINAEISRVIFPNPLNNIQNIMSFDNFENNSQLGAEINANLKLTKWWSTNASADVYYKTVRGTVTNINTNLPENKEINVTTFNTRLNNTFTATKKLRFNLFGMYRSRDLGLQYLRTPMYRVDFGANYTVLNGKGTLSARMNDMFRTQFFGFNGNIPFRQDGEFRFESRTFYVGLNYNFGSGKNKELQRKQREKNETQGGGMF